MNAIQCAVRQADHENQWGGVKLLRPETIERLQSVLKSIDDVHTMGPREIGRLQWQAFCALTDLQVDLKISVQEH